MLTTPGYQDPVEYNEAKLLNEAYDQVAAEAEITDNAVRNYFAQLVNAASSGNLTFNPDNTATLTGEYADLRNQYDDVSQVQDEYTYNGIPRRGIENHLNEIGTPSHGIFTSDKTESFRNDQLAKARAFDLFKKALKLSQYTKEEEKPKTKYNGAKYINSLIAAQLGGSEDAYTTLNQDQKLSILKSALAQAITDYQTFYDSTDWSDLQGMTSEDWLRRLENVSNLLNTEGITDNTNLAWAQLGFGNLLEQKEPIQVIGSLENPTSMSREEFIEAKLNEYKKTHKNPSKDILDTLTLTYGQQWDNQYRADLINADSDLKDSIQDRDDMDFEIYYNDYIDIPEREKGREYALENASTRYRDIYQELKNLYGFTIENSTGIITKLSDDFINNSLVINRLVSPTLFSRQIDNNDFNNIINGNDSSWFENTAYIINLMQKNPESDFTKILKNALFEDSSVPGLFYFKKRPIQGPEGKSGYVLAYDSNSNQFSIVRESQVNPEHRNIQRKRWDSERKVDSKKQGGTIKKLLPGGSLTTTGSGDYNPFDNDYEGLWASMDNSLLEAQNRYKEQVYQPDGPDKKVGGIVALNEVETPLGDVQYNISTQDYARLAAVGGDIAGLVASIAGGPVGQLVGAGLGAAGTTANLYADIQDGYSGWDVAKNAAMGYGLDVLSALPLFGIGAKGTKIAKVLKPVYRILQGIAAVSCVQALPSLGKMISHPSQMTVNDWRNIGLVINTALGGGNAIYNRTKLNNGTLIGYNKKPVQVENAQTLYKTRVGSNGQELYLRPEELKAIQSAKTLKEQRELLKKAINVKTGKAYGEEFSNEQIEAILATEPKSRWGINYGSSLSRTPGAYFSWEEMSLKPGSGFGGRYYTGHQNPSKTMPWFRQSSGHVVPKLRPSETNTPEETTTPPSKQNNGISEVLQSILNNKQKFDELYKILNAANHKHGRPIHLSKEKVKNAIKNGKLTEEDIKIIAASSKDEFKEYRRMYNFNQGGSLEFARNIQIKRVGGVLLKLYGGGSLPWIGDPYYGTWDLEGIPTDYETNYNNRAAKSLNSNINNPWHRNDHTYKRRQAINDFYITDRYNSRLQDLTDALAFYGNGSAEELMNKYNEDMQAIRDYQSNKHKYNDTDAKTHNQRYNRMFKSMGEDEALGYHTAQEDIYGPTTYLRIGDFYDSEYNDDLNDADFLDRTFKYNNQGSDVYYGKKANGDITMLSPVQLARYIALTQPEQGDPKVENPKQEEPKKEEPKKEENPKPNGKIAGGGLGIKDQQSFSDLMKKIHVRPDQLVQLSRYQDALKNLRDVYGIKRKGIQLLNGTYDLSYEQYGNYPALQEAQNIRARLNDQAANIKLTDPAKMQAAALEATAKAGQYDMQAKQLDTQMQRESGNKAWEIASGNIQRHSDTANSNINTIINPMLENITNLNANYARGKGDIINNQKLAYQQELLNIYNKRAQLSNTLLKNNDYYKRLAAWNDFQNVHHNQDKLNSDLGAIAKDYQDAWMDAQGSYRNAFLDNFAMFGAQGRKLKYHHRQQLESDKDFNKAQRESLKAFKEATQFNHKNRKK